MRETNTQTIHLVAKSTMGDFTFWISLSLSLSLRPNFTKAKLNSKSEVTFLIRTQQIAERKLPLRDSLSPKLN